MTRPFRSALLLFLFGCASLRAPRAVAPSDAARAYTAWLQAAKFDGVLRVHAITPDLPALPLGDPAQAWTVHLLVPGGVTYEERLREHSWAMVRAQLPNADVEQQLLLRAAQSLLVPAARVRVLLTRVPHGDCWRVILARTNSADITAERPCVTITVPRVAKPELTCGPEMYCTQTWTWETRLPMHVLTARLRQRYAAARYVPLQCMDYLCEVQVDRLKNEVLAGMQRWERLEILLVLIPRDDTTAIVLTVDGQYAAGIGSTPPPPASYRDMEPQHAAALTDYTKALLTSITAP